MNVDKSEKSYTDLHKIFNLRVTSETVSKILIGSQVVYAKLTRIFNPLTKYLTKERKSRETE